MAYHEVKITPKWLLDGLLEEATSENPCSGCGVRVHSVHLSTCDVARCTMSGNQLLGCHCGNCYAGVWDGQWPGTKEAYARGLVCFNDDIGLIMFDYNRLSIEKFEASQRKLHLVDK